MKKAVWTAVGAFVALLAASAPAYSEPSLKVFADTPLRAALISIQERTGADVGPRQTAMPPRVACSAAAERERSEGQDVHGGAR